MRLKIAVRKSQVISCVFALDYPSAAVTCTGWNSGEFGFESPALDGETRGVAQLDFVGNRERPASCRYINGRRESESPRYRI